jgi:S1-C subfamily serine protease
MKKILAIVLALCTLALSSCTLFEKTEKGGSSTVSSSTQSSTEGTGHQHEFTEEIVPPVCENRGYTRHTCLCGYEFIDNFINEEGTHTFERGICTVCGEFDYAEIVNLVSTEAMKANVSVTTKYINKGFGFEVTVGLSHGSGVIIDYKNGEYYFLTNNHVVFSKEMSAESEGRRFFVTDYSGNEFQATLIENSALPEYDLALLKFSSDKQYTVLDVAEKDAERGEVAVSLGQPQGQPNTVTMGEVINYGRVTITDSDVTECNVSFDTLHHDAYINNGSSGGPLLNTDLNVIGVNYAVSKSTEFAAAIPAEKVIEFLKQYFYE